MAKESKTKRSEVKAQPEEKKVVSRLDVSTVMEDFLALPPSAPPVRIVRSGFDLSTPTIHQWEVDAVRTAAKQGTLEVSDHIVNAFTDEDLDLSELVDIICRGEPASKDTNPDDGRERKNGINFEYQILDGRWVRVKVSYNGRYWAVTGHTIRR